VLASLNTCLVNTAIARFFDTWRRVITMATLNINYDFKMSNHLLNLLLLDSII